MPASHTATCPASRAPVPRTLGYAAYLDDNADNVFTRLDMALMDHRDVVPFTTAEYLSRAEVTVSILNISFQNCLTVYRFLSEFRISSPMVRTVASFGKTYVSITLSWPRPRLWVIIKTGSTFLVGRERYVLGCGRQR